MSASATTYAPRSIRSRRTKAEMERIRATIYDVLAEDHPMTVRGVFYQLVGRDAIAKIENEYKHTVVRLLTEMRVKEEISFEWIGDATRWMRKPRTYQSLTNMLELTKETYRRDLWTNQPEYVEVWLEKNAVASVLYSETAVWQVPLMVSVGFSSLTYLHEAAEAIKEVNKPAYIYNFGDWDPSGLSISTTIERRLRQFAPDAEIHFQRVAVTERQIQELHLPTRPTKKAIPGRRRLKGNLSKWTQSRQGSCATYADS